MECRHYREAIQELADGTLGPVRRAELQTHLDACAACRALAADLQTIRRTAHDLDVTRPPDHVWLQIADTLRREGRITSVAPGRSRSIAMLAIAATLLLAVGGALYTLYPQDQQGTTVTTADGGTATDPIAGGNAPTSDAVQSIADDLTTAERHYQSAIAKLEQVAKTNDGSIDPATAAILEKNLQVIDQAIAESRTALKAEPESAPARDSLFEALRQKVTVLQNTIALMNEMRKGNSAGAAQILDGANKS